MIVKTLFHQNKKLVLGHVEVKLLPGIPQLHVVGLPDISIRECALKLKSALRSLKLDWPQGQQIVVSLSPMGIRKSGAGADLAIALAYLSATGQLAPEWQAWLKDNVVYGELALNGEVHAPDDLDRALRVVGDLSLLTGRLQKVIREGCWNEIEWLNQKAPLRRELYFDWPSFWRRPDIPEFELHEKAAKAMLLALHMKLNVLVAGPQGSGKSTWARSLHAFSPPPCAQKLTENAEHFGEEVFAGRWRPLENPHHTITPLAMIGGGVPLQPGVITRAHGGVLLMDEFLCFHPNVLEALRVPIENGHIDLNRSGNFERFPADFQLVATTNLCPCGKLDPAATRRQCSYNLIRCKSVSQRLSGPLLDRFDMLVLSNEWLQPGAKVSVEEVFRRLEGAQAVANERSQVDTEPAWIGQLGLSHRRRRSLMKVARALADLDGSQKLQGRHAQEAFDLVVTPMQKLRELFA